MFRASLLTLAVAAVAASAQAPKKGDVIAVYRFDEAGRKAWSVASYAGFETGREGRPALKVSTTEADGGQVRAKLDLSKYAGCKIRGECWVKADGVTKPAETWNGVKVMLHYTSASVGQRWINEGNVFGSFDWKPLRFTEVLPADIKEADLSLGMQSCSGTVWFDELKLTVVAPPRPPRPKPDPNAPPAFKGHNLPRLRGVMSPNAYRDEDLRHLGQDWHANLIRWQMTRNWGVAGTDQDLADYGKWMDGKLDEAAKALDACAKYGIKLVLDVHSPPGGRTQDNTLRMTLEPKFADAFVALWEKIATRFKGHPALWAYDLVNEPVQTTPPPDGVDDYLAVQVRAAKAIRHIDPTTAILIEADQWDSAGGYRDLDPVDVPNVVYQMHMYDPGQFTHQGVHDNKVGVVYPGEIGGVKYDKERLRAVLQPVRDFQLAYNVHIYAGEFSAIRWAPGDSATQYLRDVIELFEEYGWDWSYHAYREWDGWSLEHGPDPNDHQPTAEPTDRLKLMLGWFAKNQRP